MHGNWSLVFEGFDVGKTDCPIPKPEDPRPKTKVLPSSILLPAFSRASFDVVLTNTTPLQLEELCLIEPMPGSCCVSTRKATASASMPSQSKRRCAQAQNGMRRQMPTRMNGD